MANLMGLLNNDIIRGVGGAAAFGANPLFGLLAAPLIKDRREARELDMEARRAELRELNRRRQSTDRLQGLLAARGTPPFREGADTPRIETEAGQRQALGLLADISPNVAAQGLLSNSSPHSEPAALRLIRALRDPSLDEGQKELIRQNVAGQGGEGLLQQVELQRLQIDLQRSLLDLQEKTNTQKDLETERERTIRTQSTNILNLVERATALENEFLQPGAPLMQGREFVAGVGRLTGDLLGTDTPGLDKQVTNLGELRKGLADLSIDMQTRFAGTFTNDKLALLQQAMATTSNDPATIRTILRQITDLYLEKADQFDISLPNRKALEAFARPQARRQEPITDTRDASELTDEEILKGLGL